MAGQYPTSWSLPMRREWTVGEYKQVADAAIHVWAGHWTQYKACHVLMTALGRSWNSVRTKLKDALVDARQQGGSHPNVK